ncbi:FIG006045: Sigma factor, ECF subfamily [plant metagenome]|uniref:FIG006045: Sigma factor, ECF subfamily n=1 Tax=plant metagenome TaxID=1297885 RepID=A0A484UXT0_9ZZZZ
MDMSVPFHIELAAEAGFSTGVVKDGEPLAALRRHLEAHYGTLLRRLTAYLGAADLATECLHDAWLRLGDMTLPSCVDNLDAYVYQVARNAALDRLRGERHIKALSELDSEIALPDPRPGPEQRAETRSTLARLDHALQVLPFRHRCVLFDLRVEGRTRAQVAATYGLSLGRIDTVLRQTLDCCVSAMQEAHPPRQRALRQSYAQSEGGETALA